MNEDVNGNRKLFWKEVNNAKGRKVESCSRINDGIGRLAQGEDEVCEDIYNSDTQVQVAVHICEFDGIQRGNYFGGEPIGKAEVEVEVGTFKNGKAVGKDEITGKIIKG